MYNIKINKGFELLLITYYVIIEYNPSLV